jgi:prophage antirepressor-like protein
MVDGKPHFVAKDVAERLGYANTNEAIQRHCRGVVKRYPIIPARVVVDLFPSVAPALPRQLGETGHRQCGPV